MPGPVPKRSTERRRRNKPEGGLTVVDMTGFLPTPAPEADPAWHPIAREWFDALADSGQSQFYEPSDWAVARLCAELITSEFEKGKPRAIMVAEITKLMGTLLSTEGDRRRVRMELNRGDGEKDTTTDSIMAAYRDSFGA